MAEESAQREAQAKQPPPRPRRNWRRYYLLLNIAFLAILAWTFTRLEWVDLRPMLKLHNLGWLLAVTAIYCLTYAVESWAWAFIMGQTGARYSLAKAFRAMMASNYLARITPARVGKYILVAYAARDLNVSFGFALCGFMVWEVTTKFVGWLTQTLGCIVALFLLTPIANIPPSVVAWIAVAAALGSLPTFILLALTVSRRFHQRALAALQRIPYIRRRGEGAERQLAEFHCALGNLRWSRLALTIPPLIANYFLAVLIGFLIFRTLGSNMPYLTFWQCAAVGAVAARVLPISFAGVGTNEFTIFMLSDRLGYGRSAPIGFAVVNGFISRVVLPAIGAIFWLASPLLPAGGGEGTVEEGEPEQLGEAQLAPAEEER